MSRSKGPLSPIQPASSPSRWGCTPRTPVQHTESSLARSSPHSPDLRPRSVCRRPNPPSPLVSRPSRQPAALHTPQPAVAPTPQPAPVRRDTLPRHPSKRAPSARDIMSDDLPTPEKVTPSKRGVDGKKKSREVRTPFRTLNTPTSASSSKTSLSSTASLLTPNSRIEHTPNSRIEHTPTSPQFKVPSYSISSKSRQRLKRL